MATDRSNANSAASSAPAAAAREEAKSADRLQWLKEIVTAVLGIGIVVYTLIMIGRAFDMAGDTSRMGDVKVLFPT
jgi:hypothetical protein